jgi:hypothetical protein
MTNRIPRLALSVFTALFAVAVLSVSTAHADEEDDPISTTCGAGTLNECGRVADIQCDWVIEFAYNGGWRVAIKIGRTNCKVEGYLPVYKDRDNRSSLSGSCNLLSPFVGMPPGTGCSDEFET